MRRANVAVSILALTVSSLSAGCAAWQDVIEQIEQQVGSGGTSGSGTSGGGKSGGGTSDSGGRAGGDCTVATSADGSACKRCVDSAGTIIYDGCSANSSGSAGAGTVGGTGGGGAAGTGSGGSTATGGTCTATTNADGTICKTCTDASGKVIAVDCGSSGTGGTPSEGSGGCVKIDDGGPTSCKPAGTWKTYGADRCAQQMLQLTDIAYGTSCADGSYETVTYVCCAGSAGTGATGGSVGTTPTGGSSGTGAIGATCTATTTADGVICKSCVDATTGKVISMDCAGG